MPPCFWRRLFRALPSGGALARAALTSCPRGCACWRCNWFCLPARRCRHENASHRRCSGHSLWVVDADIGWIGPVRLGRHGGRRALCLVVQLPRRLRLCYWRPASDDRASACLARRADHPDRERNGVCRVRLAGFCGGGLRGGYCRRDVVSDSFLGSDGLGFRAKIMTSGMSLLYRAVWPTQSDVNIAYLSFAHCYGSASSPRSFNRRSMRDPVL